MAGFGKISAAVLCLSVMSGVGRAQEVTGGQATLRIKTRVYNMAKVRPAVLGGGLSEAGTIFNLETAVDEPSYGAAAASNCGD
jgi:hypothetical protein